MKNSNVKVIWITGLSGSGKTTIAKKLTFLLRKAGKPVVMLDGDSLREAFGTLVDNKKQFTFKSRLELAACYAKMCKQIASQGIYVVIATISMFHKIQKWNRNNLPGYYEVFLDVPFDELKKRDTKKLYKINNSKKNLEVVGLGILAEKPLSPNMVIEYNPKKSITEIVNHLFINIEK